jgi:hypothetical protein
MIYKQEIQPFIFRGYAYTVRGLSRSAILHFNTLYLDTSTIKNQ